MDPTYYVCLLVPQNGFANTDVFTEPSPTREFGTLCSVIFEGSKPELLRWAGLDTPEVRTTLGLMAGRGLDLIARLRRPSLSDPAVRLQMVRTIVKDGGGIIPAIKEAREACGTGLKETKDAADEVRNALIACGALSFEPAATSGG